MHRIEANAIGLLYLCPTADSAAAPVEPTVPTVPNGAERIALACKEYLTQSSIGYDLANKSEAALMDVAADVILGKTDSFGISRKHPDRDERLEIAGALIATVLDKRTATKDAVTELNRLLALSTKFVKINKEDVVESGDCMCGFSGNYKLVNSTLESGRLWVKYQCPACGRLGERAWLE